MVRKTSLKLHNSTAVIFIPDGVEMELAARIELHVPDEHSRRVGQAEAAASLPKLS